MISTPQEEIDPKWLILHAKLFEEKIKQAFRIFRQSEIEPVLIKGWAAARFYTNKSERFYTDIDLCVEPGLFHKASELLKNEEAKKLAIDLHSGFRHLDTVSWENLFRKSQLVNLDEINIRVLRPEDHLRILCVHWLTDGGAYREKLKDIYFAIENRPADFDWGRCLGVVSENRRRWIVCTIGLAKKYFGLSLKNTPIELEAENLPEWLIRAVEKEWMSDVRLLPLHRFYHDRKRLWQQIRKRVPPNPIQATVELEGNFDDSPRIYYQIKSIFTRMIPFLKRFKINVQNSQRNSHK